MLYLEVRKKIIQARKNGLEIPEIAKAYGVREQAIFSLLKQERETGNIEPRIHERGKKPTLNGDRLEELQQLIIARPDITLQEIKEKMDISTCIKEHMIQVLVAYHC